MDQARAEGDASARQLRDWLVKSDAALDPHAYILSPASAIQLGEAVVRAPNYYLAGKAAALASLHLMRDGHQGGVLRLSKREAGWLATIENTLGEMPDSEEVFTDQMMAKVDQTKFIPVQYF